MRPYVVTIFLKSWAGAVKETVQADSPEEAMIKVKQPYLDKGWVIEGLSARTVESEKARQEELSRQYDAAEAEENNNQF